MNEHHQTQTDTHTHRIDHYGDEIELMDYLLVIWKWKYLILGGTLLGAIIVLTISIMTPKTPKTYRIDMMFTSGIKDINETGKKVYIEPASNTKALIESAILNKEISSCVKNSSNGDGTKSLSFDVSIQGNLNVIKVSYETIDPNKGVTILNCLTEILLNEYSDQVQFYKDDSDRKIKLKKSDLAVLNLEKERIKKETINIQKTLADLESKNKLIANELQSLLKQRNDFWEKTSQDTLLSNLLVSNIIQENLNVERSYFEQIQRYNSIMNNIEYYLSEKQKHIEKILVEIEILEEKKNNIQNIKILQPPTAAQLLTEKSKTKIHTILASFFGFFLTIFLAFFIEYIRKYKSRVQDEKRGDMLRNQCD